MESSGDISSYYSPVVASMSSSPTSTPSSASSSSSGSPLSSIYHNYDSSSTVESVAPPQPFTIRSMACRICASHKVKCDGQRPCVRCVRLNRPHQCVDRIPGQPKVSTRKRRNDSTDASLSSIIHAAPPPPITMVPPVATAASATSLSIEPTHSDADHPAPTTYLAPVSHAHFSTMTAYPAPTSGYPLQETVTAAAIPVTITITPVPAIDITQYHYGDGGSADMLAIQSIPLDDALPQSPLLSSPPPSSSTSSSIVPFLSSPVPDTPLVCMDIGPLLSSWLSPSPSPSSSSSSSTPSSSSSSDDQVDGVPLNTTSTSSDIKHSTADNRAHKRERFESTNTSISTVATPSSSLLSSSSFTSSMPATSMPRSIIVFNETRVFRQALIRLQRWFIDHMTYNYTSTNHGYDWCSKVVTNMRPRVCIYCISPSLPCATCAAEFSAATNTTSSLSTTSSSGMTMTNVKGSNGRKMRRFSEQFAKAFLSSHWYPRSLHMVTPPVTFNALSMGCMAMTWPNVAMACATEAKIRALVEYHSSALESISTNECISDMAVAMIESSSPSKSLLLQHTDDLPSSAASQRHPTVEGSAMIDPTTVPVLPTSLLSASSSIPLPRPAMAVSTNDALERLTGYSKREMYARVGTLGWKIDIALASPAEVTLMFQNTFLAVVGKQTSWSMIGHVVTKWHAVVKCLIWGKNVTRNGYRTTLMYFVPLPSPLSNDPSDPIFHS